MSLNSGGHLTHGAKAEKTVRKNGLMQFHYEVKEDTGLVDYDQVEN